MGTCSPVPPAPPLYLEYENYMRRYGEYVPKLSQFMPPPPLPWHARHPHWFTFLVVAPVVILATAFLLLPELMK